MIWYKRKRCPGTGTTSVGLLSEQFPLVSAAGTKPDLTGLLRRNFLHPLRKHWRILFGEPCRFSCEIPWPPPVFLPGCLKPGRNGSPSRARPPSSPWADTSSLCSRFRRSHPLTAWYGGPVDSLTTAYFVHRNDDPVRIARNTKIKDNSGAVPFLFTFIAPKERSGISLQIVSDDRYPLFPDPSLRFHTA